MCYQPQYTPAHPPKAACVSLNPAMLSGQMGFLFFSIKSTKENLFVYLGSSKSDAWPGHPPLLLPIPTSSLDHVKTCVPTRTKTQIFQSKHLFPPKKQLTFRGHSVRHYKANAHSNHHQGALNSFVVVLCGLHQFSHVKPEGNDVGDQTDKTPATVKRTTQPFPYFNPPSAKTTCKQQDKQPTMTLLRQETKHLLSKTSAQ